MEDNITALNHHSGKGHTSQDVDCLNRTGNLLQALCDKEPDESNNNINNHSVRRYEVNEKVYVNENSQVYLAKVIKTRFRTLEIPRSKKRKRVSLKELLIQEQIKLHGPFWEYYIHFNGWSARHDKWCRQDVIMKDSEEARELAAISVERQKLEDIKRKEKKIFTKQAKRKNSSKNNSPSKDKKLDSALPNIKNGSKTRIGAENELQYQKGLIGKTFEQYCTLPFTLQTILVDDQNMITKLGRHVAIGHDNSQYFSTNKVSQMVHLLPVNTNITVESILRAFAKSKIKEYSTNHEELLNTYKQFCDDMVDLFEVALPKFLLYPQERKQYTLLWDNTNTDTEREIKPVSPMNCGTTMAGIFGGEFLLRFLVRLPQFMTCMNETCTDITQLNCMGTTIAKWRLYYEKDHQVLGRLISELIIFLQKHKNKCFKAKYKAVKIEINESK